LCGVAQALEHHNHVARLHIDFRADEAMGGKASVDFGRPNGINLPAEGVCSV
jgi:hypothetical protein